MRHSWISICWLLSKCFICLCIAASKNAIPNEKKKKKKRLFAPRPCTPSSRTQRAPWRCWHPPAAGRLGGGRGRTPAWPSGLAPSRWPPTGPGWWWAGGRLPGPPRPRSSPQRWPSDLWPCGVPQKSRRVQLYQSDPIRWSTAAASNTSQESNLASQPTEKY